MRITKMMGKPLSFVLMCDFRDPSRRDAVSWHTSIETAEKAAMRTARGGVSPYGWLWAKEVGGMETFKEIILKSQKTWLAARDRAMASRNSFNFAQSSAPCCIYRTDHHLGTVRHFWYWVLNKTGEALQLWPWLRDVIAADVLSGVSE
jgi:hypothetical protein